MTLKSKRGNIYPSTGEQPISKQFTKDREAKIIYCAHKKHLNVVLQPNTTNQQEIYNSCYFIQLTVHYLRYSRKMLGFFDNESANDTQRTNDNLSFR